MAKQDTRRGRAWIKVQMKNDSESHHAAEIVTYWKATKAAALHIPRAIRMYYALLQGDTSLLREYFPLLTLGQGRQSETVKSAMPPKVKIEHRERTEEEDKADLLDGLF